MLESDEHAQVLEGSKCWPVSHNGYTNRRVEVRITDVLGRSCGQSLHMLLLLEVWQ